MLYPKCSPQNRFRRSCPRLLIGCLTLAAIAIAADPPAISKITAKQIHECLSSHYAGKQYVQVKPFGGEPPAELDPEALNGTNQMELFVFENAQNGEALLVARLDNLGKGAGRAALQNASLMLGLK